MSIKQMHLLNLLCEQVGITTAKQLEEFKKAKNANTNEELIKRLALYVAVGEKFKGE